MSYRSILGCALLGALFSVGCGPGKDNPPSCGTTKQCDCEPGDSNCNQCQVGYRPALVGSECVPTCSAASFSCGDHGTCEDTAQGASCRCEPGYSGASCAECAGGLTPNQAGRCFGELKAPALLSLTSVNDEVVVGALEPPRWSFVPLAFASSGVTDVAYDSRNGRVYTLESGRLSTLDLKTGKSQELTDGSVDLGTTLCLDEVGQRAFTATDDVTYEIELETHAVTELGTFGASALDYDAARGVLLGVDPMGATFEVAESGPLSVGQAPELESLGMAFDAAAGRAYFLGSPAETPDDRLLRYCGTALARLGAVPAWQAQLVEEVPAAADPLVADYDGADSALVAFNLAGSDVTSLRLTSPHPDAALCIVAQEGTAALDIEVTAEARAGFILVAAPERDVNVDLSALEGDSSSSIFVYTDGDLTIAGPSGGVTEYGPQAWSNLGLTSLARLGPPASSQLVLMDWASQAAFSVELEHRPVVGALAWVGSRP